MPNAFIRFAALTATAACTLLWQGCLKDKTYVGGCLSSAKDCQVSSPCADLQFSCTANGGLEARILSATFTRPGGLDALGARGDILLKNDQVTAVIAGLGSQNYLDPNGGSLLDLSTQGDNNDGLTQVAQVVGILPRDAAHYTEYQLISEAGRVGVQLKGVLDGLPKATVYTLYELRPCDRGLRIRTEVVNGTADTQYWTLTDGFYWSLREPLPFTPEPGGGFNHPPFGLTTINDVFKPFPYMAASLHAPPYVSYATVGCNVKQLEGFNSQTISSAGVPRQVVSPRDYLVFERFLAVAKSNGVSGAVDIVQEVRSQLFGEKYVTLTGKVQRLGALALGSERETSILVIEGTLATDPSKRVPWTQVVPNADGTFSARVPAGKDYVFEVHSFGQKQAEREVAAVSADTVLEPFILPSTARITATVLDAQNSQPMNAELFLIPADEATRQAVAGSFHGQFGDCSPWLGPPPGGSPACNRVLTSDAGPVTFEVPVGNFYVYATRGPFWSLQRQRIQPQATDQSLTFTLTHLPLQPKGTLSADLHVHGAASFDSTLPDLDRVRSFSAADIQVIAATDHDVVGDYGATLRALNLQDKMTAINGLESTGHIPFLYVPGYDFPLVIGHYNFWPLRYDPSAQRRGAPFDELLEPGQLFDAMEGHWSGSVPLIELNHPWSRAEFGRDLGFPRAIALDLRKNLPSTDDGTNQGVYVRAKGQLHNNDHHAQEVMNGTQNETYLEFRAFWFYTLNQGQLKTGTANSDSHSLVDSTLGLPRNVVYTNTVAGTAFDVDRFNTSVRGGTVLGTNGPIIEATVDRESGGPVGYSLTPFKPASNGKLHLKVSAAPWVPVQEIRIVVNGVVVKTVDLSNKTPVDPFASDVSSLIRFDGDVALSELLSGTQDAWMVVEAGRKLPLVGDLGGGLNNQPDGVPDTTDNNGDGQVTLADRGPGLSYGPLNLPGAPSSEADPQFHFSVVVTDASPAAFTNPFVMDRNGNGRFDAPGVAGAP